MTVTKSSRGHSTHPWAHPPPLTLDLLRAAEAYLDARPLEEQIAVISLMRTIEGR